MSQKSPPPKKVQNSNTAHIGIIVAVITSFGVIITAVLSYMSTVKQIELPIQATQTAEARLLNINATNTNQVFSTSTPQNQSISTPNLVATLVYDFTKSAKIIYNPKDGLIVHSNGNAIDGSKNIGISLQNFIVSVKFLNPYGIDEGKWDYGVMFRKLGGGENYRLFVRYDSTWILYLAGNPGGTIHDTVIDKGFIRNLDLSPNGSNKIKLIVNGQIGYFFVNDELIKELDVSARNLAGDIELGTAFDLGNKIVGRVTRYEDFSVWSLP